ncbi:hypothetical protein V9L20_15990 [Variovorax sp. CCNWLW225]|uniref:hypothetical protein n=1 Tax=Variovorax sp. CCNWLW225 TaxID=3127462 RepID=UPI0030770D19
MTTTVSPKLMPLPQRTSNSKQRGLESLRDLKYKRGCAQSRIPCPAASARKAKASSGEIRMILTSIAPPGGLAVDRVPEAPSQYFQGLKHLCAALGGRRASLWSWTEIVAATVQRTKADRIVSDSQQIDKR